MSPLSRSRPFGSGGSRAAILARSGFDTSGPRQAASLLQKDIGIVIDLARAKGAAEPESVLRLADETLSILRDAADVS